MKLDGAKQKIREMLTETQAIGLPLIEIADGRRVLIENHRGIIEYGAETVAVRLRRGIACVDGTGLTIGCIAKQRLVICGTIHSVRLLQGGTY